MTLLKARGLKIFSADTCSCSPLYCVFFEGIRRLSISIQDSGKGKVGEEEANVADVEKLISMTSVPLEVRKEDFRPLQNIFCSVSGVLLFCTSTFFATCPLRWVAVYQGSYKKEGGDRHSLSFLLRLQCISLGCLEGGKWKVADKRKNEKEPLHSFIEKEEFRSKDKKAFLKKVSCHPVRPESG